MQVQYKLNDKLTFVVEGKDQKDIFQQLSDLWETFGNDCCQNCKSTNTRFEVRTIDGNSFYSMRCLDCYSDLQFGVHKVGGGLFSKTRDENNKSLRAKGWLKWNNEKKIRE